MAQIPINIPDIIEELKPARGQMMQGPTGHSGFSWHLLRCPILRDLCNSPPRRMSFLRGEGAFQILNTGLAAQGARITGNAYQV